MGTVDGIVLGLDDDVSDGIHLVILMESKYAQMMVLYLMLMMNHLRRGI